MALAANFFQILALLTIVVQMIPHMVPKFLDKKSTPEGTLFEDAPFSIYQLDLLVFLRILENTILGTNDPKYSRQSSLFPEIYSEIV